MDDPVASRAAAILAELDGRGAPDLEYRSAFSTAAKNPLRAGETWRGRLMAWVNGETRAIAEDADGKWMTHTELAESRGISKASAARLVRRHKWRRQADNQQRVQILVPFDAISEPDIRKDIRPEIRMDIRTDDRTDNADISRIVSAFDSAISALRERAEAAERQAEAERARVDTTERRAEAAEARTTAAIGLLREAGESLTAERASRLAAEAEAAAAIEAASVEAEQFRQAAEQARRTAAKVEAAIEEAAIEAEQAAQAAEAEIAQLRQAAEQARAEAQEAVQAAETLRQAEAARAAVQAPEPADRPAMVASRIDELQLRRLQEAEQARKALGRLARLKAAWRGE
jgi:hypothetical protein